MKYTHNALTSITVEKVENITTSMTRAGLGDDTYRRQREKERYLKCKQEQADKEERRREEFMNERELKIKKSHQVTEKKSLKRQKKKELQKQRQKKMKMLKKLGQASQSGQDQDLNSNKEELNKNMTVENIINRFNGDEVLGEMRNNDQEQALLIKGKNEIADKQSNQLIDGQVINNAEQ